MPPYPKVGAEVVLDTDSYNRAVSSVIADAGKVDAALKDLSGAVDVKVSVDDGEVTSAVSTLLQLEDDASVKVNVDDGEVTTAIGDVDKLSEDQSTKVNVDDAEVQQTLALLEQIRNLSIINIALDVPVAAMDFVNKLPGVMALIQGSAAVNTLKAATGGAVQGGEQIITDLYTKGFGESQEAVARFVGMLHNIGVEDDNLSAVATDLYEAQAAITGITGVEPDMVSLLARAEDLKNLGLADSWSSATDVIVAGYQSSIGISGDFLGDLGEFAPTFAALGFTSEQMLNTLNTGLSGGVDNISRMSEGVISFNELASGMDENFVKALDTIDKSTGSDLAGQMELFQAGESTGADFMASVLDAARVYAETEGKVEAQALLSNLFGSTAENIGVEALLAVDPNAEGITSIEDRAQETADTVRDNWRTTLTELQRTIETELAATLDETFDIQDRLKTAKEQFQTFVDELQSGKSVGDAIEIAFGVEGVDTALLNIERVFGNFYISLLEAIAFIQDPTGLGTADDATRAEITRLATQQLSFDLKVANPEEMDAIMEQAARRGVDALDIGAGLSKALDELLAEGEFEQLLNMTDVIMQSPDITPEAKQAFRDKYITPLSDTFDEAIETGDFDLAKKISDAQNDPTEYTDALKGKFGFNAAAFDQMAADFATGMETSIAKASWWDNIKPPETTVTAIEDTESKLNALQTTSESVMQATESAAALSSPTIVDAILAMGTAAEDADATIATAMTGNTVTASFDAVKASAEANFPVVVSWFGKAKTAVVEFDQAAQRLSAVVGKIAALANAVNQFPMSKLQAISNASTGNLGGGGGGSTTTVNQNITQTNNVSNNAQGTASTYQLAAALGGAV